jgi:hypothetical protein
MGGGAAVTTESASADFSYSGQGSVCIMNAITALRILTFYIPIESAIRENLTASMLISRP